MEKHKSLAVKKPKPSNAKEKPTGSRRGAPPWFSLNSFRHRNRSDSWIKRLSQSK